METEVRILRSSSTRAMVGMNEALPGGRCGRDAQASAYHARRWEILPKSGFHETQVRRRAADCYSPLSFARDLRNAASPFATPGFRPRRDRQAPPADHPR